MRMEQVLRQKSGSRVAVQMREEDYNKLCDFIITLVSQAGADGISLHNLVVEAQQKFDADFKGNVSWYLLQVKLDLESHKLIQKTISPQREQIIRLNPNQGKKWWFN
ncbi:MAG: hypothetical protein KF763_15680 [Cyclobacteriaceae bacterium]|nr:hypothetical protein [Cyclobacteriaceae bacterium]